MSLFTQNSKSGNASAKIREAVIFTMLGTLMFCSKIIMDVLPNIHIVGVLTIVYTIAFRKKALFPIYIFVLLSGIYGGFSFWWLPYLYIWTVLWGVTMLLPKNMPAKTAYIVYPFVCALHGLFYGTLYAPVQALVMGFSFEQMLAWIITGLPFDGLHFAGNLIAGSLIYPLSKVLKKLMITRSRNMN